MLSPCSTIGRPLTGESTVCGYTQPLPLSLTPGLRLGQYEIAAAIGADGPPPFAPSSTSANYGEVHPLSPQSGSGETTPKLGTEKDRAEAGRSPSRTRP